MLALQEAPSILLLQMARHGGCGLQETLRELPNCSYYYGTISVEEAEAVLAQEPDGSFLVRDTLDPDSRFFETYTLTFKSQGTFGSIRVDFAKGYFSLCLGQANMAMYQTVMLLVEDAVRTSKQGEPVCVLGGHLPHRDVDLFLTNPVKRNTKPNSLQHLCRKALYNRFARHELSSLPLPAHIKDYILSSPHFDASLYANQQTTATRTGQSEISNDSGSK